jgi:hypothetical protein
MDGAGDANRYDLGTHPWATWPGHYSAAAHHPVADALDGSSAPTHELTTLIINYIPDAYGEYELETLCRPYVMHC